MATIDWTDGRLITLGAGNTARCTSLAKGQLYAVVIYNSSPADQNAVVTVVWTNQEPPKNVPIPGTTNDSGPATFIFISGDDTEFVSISLAANAGTTTIAACVVSVSMPTNTAGLSNTELPSDGQNHPYHKFDRYFATPPMGWSRFMLVSPVSQLISLELRQTQAMIIVLNLGAGLSDGQVRVFGPTARAKGTVRIKKVASQTYGQDIQGDGGQWVWMNGDSQQNSSDVEISLQGLSVLVKFSRFVGLRRL